MAAARATCSCRHSTERGCGVPAERALASASWTGAVSVPGLKKTQWTPSSASVQTSSPAASAKAPPWAGAAPTVSFSVVSVTRPPSDSVRTRSGGLQALGQDDSFRELADDPGHLGRHQGGRPGLGGLRSQHHHRMETSLLQDRQPGVFRAPLQDLDVLVRELADEVAKLRALLGLVL